MSRQIKRKKITLKDIFPNMETHKESRGNLFAMEFSNVPFSVKRVFLVYDVPKDTIRGKHSHIQTKQQLVCVKGEILVSVIEKDGTIKNEILTEGKTFFMDKLVWGQQTFLTGNDILMVLCNTIYDESDYIRDFSEYKKYI